MNEEKIKETVLVVLAIVGLYAILVLVATGGRCITF